MGECAKELLGDSVLSVDVGCTKACYEKSRDSVSRNLVPTRGRRGEHSSKSMIVKL